MQLSLTFNCLEDQQLSETMQCFLELDFENKVESIERESGHAMDPGECFFAPDNPGNSGFGEGGCWAKAEDEMRVFWDTERQIHERDEFVTAALPVGITSCS